MLRDGEVVRTRRRSRSHKTVKSFARDGDEVEVAFQQPLKIKEKQSGSHRFSGHFQHVEVAFRNEHDRTKSTVAAIATDSTGPVVH